MPAITGLGGYGLSAESGPPDTQLTKRTNIRALPKNEKLSILFNTCQYEVPAKIFHNDGRNDSGPWNKTVIVQKWQKTSLVCRLGSKVLTSNHNISEFRKE